MIVDEYSEDRNSIAHDAQFFKRPFPQPRPKAIVLRHRSGIGLVGRIFVIVPEG